MAARLQRPSAEADQVTAVFPGAVDRAEPLVGIQLKEIIRQHADDRPGTARRQDTTLRYPRIHGLGFERFARFDTFGQVRHLAARQLNRTRVATVCATAQPGLSGNALIRRAYLVAHRSGGELVAKPSPYD